MQPYQVALCVAEESEKAVFIGDLRLRHGNGAAGRFDTLEGFIQVFTGVQVNHRSAVTGLVAFPVHQGAAVAMAGRREEGHDEIAHLLHGHIVTEDVAVKKPCPLHVPDRDLKPHRHVSHDPAPKKFIYLFMIFYIMNRSLAKPFQTQGANCHQAERHSKQRVMMKTLYFDDFKVGDRFESPGITVTEGQIIDFAMQFDPQVFHLDTEAAKKTIYGGLIASGIHTIALTFRLFLMTGALNAENSLGSPGFDELRWLLPVRPGDTLRAVGEVLELRPSKSQSDRGIVRVRYTAFNQKDELVFSVNGNQIVRRKT